MLSPTNESVQERDEEEEEALDAALPAREGEHSRTDDDDEEPNVKHARTISGGEDLQVLDDWMGVWGKQGFPHWRRRASALRRLQNILQDVPREKCSLLH